MFDQKGRQGKDSLFGFELADLQKEVRRDRLISLVFRGALPFIALAVLHQSLTTLMILQAYVLTSMQFGYIFLVEEPENTKRSWFWKAMGLLILLHLVVLAIIFSWDIANPDIAGKGLVLTFALWVAALPEFALMLWILEICRPSENGTTASQRRGPG